MRFIHAFGIGVLILFGVYFLYFNLVMALNVVGSSDHLLPFLGLFVIDNTRWTSDYYFGFASLFGNGLHGTDRINGILNDLPRAISFDYTLQMFEEFVNSLTGLKGTLDDIQNLTYFTGGGSFWDTLVAIGNLLFNIGKIIFDILISPFQALIAFITLNVEIFTTIIDVLVFIKNILEGNYNLPISNWTSPLQGDLTTNPNTGGVPPVIQITYNGGTISYY